jgi:N-acetylglucosamine-binding protein A
MLPGTNTFDWQLTANHVTRDWRYFITKQNWDQTHPLTRDAFDLTPFCFVSGNFQNPPFQFSQTCNVPVRSGYQIILGVWDVGDTTQSFYHVIDVQMPDDGTPPPVTELKDIGDINPSSDLNIGDIVRIRLFTAGGELIDQAIEMIIADDDQGKMNTWPKLFAEFINTQNTELEAGIKDAQGNIVPVFGRNDVFTDISSAITRIEIDIDLAEVGASLDIGLQQTTLSTGEPMQLVFDVTADPAMSITAELFFQGARIGYQQAPHSSSTQLQIDIQDPQAGSYQLIVIGETADHQQIVQESFTVTVSDPADFVYPDNIGSYVAGDLIRGQDGNTYRCLIAGWCNGSRTYYAPGLGLAWSSAWALVAGGSAQEVEAEFTYPNGRGQYQQGMIVKGADNDLYRCDISVWCNSQSSLYYAPGNGLAWDSAWSSL